MSLRVRAAVARHDLEVKVVEPLRWRLLALVPRPLVYWVLLHAGARHCGGPAHPEEVVPEVPFVTVLERWSPPVRTR